MACEVVAAADVTTDSGAASDDTRGGGVATAAARRSERDRQRARACARDERAEGDGSETGGSEAGELPAAPRRQRRATLADVLAQSVMGAEAWRQLRASGAEGREEEDRGAGAARYRPPGPTGLEQLNTQGHAAAEAIAAARAARADFTPTVQWPHPPYAVNR